MDVLVVYDNEGYIYYFIPKDAETRKPVGIPSLEVTIPKGKSVERIDVSMKPHKPIFIDLPLDEVDVLKKNIADLTFQLMVKGVI